MVQLSKHRFFALSLFNCSIMLTAPTMANGSLAIHCTRSPAPSLVPPSAIHPFNVRWTVRTELSLSVWLGLKLFPFSALFTEHPCEATYRSKLDGKSYPTHPPNNKQRVHPNRCHFMGLGGVVRYRCASPHVCMYFLSSFCSIIPRYYGSQPFLNPRAPPLPHHAQKINAELPPKKKHTHILFPKHTAGSILLYV